MILGQLRGRELDLADAKTILVHLRNRAAARALGLGFGVVELGLREGQSAAVVRGLAVVPGVVLDEADLSIDDLSGASWQRPLTYNGRLACHGVDQGAPPGRAADVLDLQVVGVGVVSEDVDGAAHAGATIGARVAVGVVSRGAALERGEGRVDDFVSARVWAGLEASVSDFFDVMEVELLGKIVACLVGGFGDVEGESDVVESVSGSTGKPPLVSDESEGEGGHTSEKGGSGELHCFFSLGEECRKDRRRED